MRYSHRFTEEDRDRLQIFADGAEHPRTPADSTLLLRDYIRPTGNGKAKITGLGYRTLGLTPPERPGKPQGPKLDPKDAEFLAAVTKIVRTNELTNWDKFHQIQALIKQQIE